MAHAFVCFSLALSQAPDPALHPSALPPLHLPTFPSRSPLLPAATRAASQQESFTNTQLHVHSSAEPPSAPRMPPCAPSLAGLQGVSVPTRKRHPCWPQDMGCGGTCLPQIVPSCNYLTTRSLYLSDFLFRPWALPGQIPRHSINASLFRMDRCSYPVGTVEVGMQEVPVNGQPGRY